MSKKSNVHPDYYKTAGRDRQDDAAAARQARAIAAKPSSQERPDRMGKGFYFERPEPPTTASAAPTAEGRSQKRTSSRAGAAKKSGTRKTTRATATRRTAAPRKATATRRKRSGTGPARPTKKR